MPAPIPVEIRRQIVTRHESGETLVEISQTLGLSYETVKRLWGRWRKEGKLTPNYEQAKRRGTRRYGSIYEAAIQMKRDHPKWGAGLIRIQLERDYPSEKSPSTRTLQRWFRTEGIGRTPPVRRQRQAVQRGQTVHDVWAVDAKEHIRLEDGREVSWLTVTDEASGAILVTEVFPRRQLGESQGAGGTAVSQADV
jgi:transposase